MNTIDDFKLNNKKLNTIQLWKKSFKNKKNVKPLVITGEKGVGKTTYSQEELPITPELEIMLRNLLNIADDPEKKVEHYKMIPWLFGTRAWKFEKYWDKKFRESPDARLGGDENYVPSLIK